MLRLLRYLQCLVPYLGEFRFGGMGSKFRLWSLLYLMQWVQSGRKAWTTEILPIMDFLTSPLYSGLFFVRNIVAMNQTCTCVFVPHIVRGIALSFSQSRALCGFTQPVLSSTADWSASPDNQPYKAKVSKKHKPELWDSKFTDAQAGYTFEADKCDGVNNGHEGCSNFPKHFAVMSTHC